MCCSRFTLLFLLLAIPSACFSWPAEVVSIADGDTITVLHQGQRKEIRLYGIDCPEKGQDQGEQAKALTSALVSGRAVEVEQKDIDRYGRIVGAVKVRSGPGNLDKPLSGESATTTAQRWAQHGAENGKRNKTETFSGIQSKSGSGSDSRRQNSG